MNCLNCGESISGHNALNARSCLYVISDDNTDKEKQSKSIERESST